MFSKYLKTSKSDTILNFVDLLEEEGYEIEKRIGKNKDSENMIFSKAGVDEVFILITQYSNERNGSNRIIDFVVIDKDVYERYFKASKYAFIRICFKGKENRSGNERYEFVVHCEPSGITSSKIHRAVVGLYGDNVNKDIEVDHITHCRNINTSSALRTCVAQENTFNKPMYCRVRGNKFDLRDRLIDIQSRQELAEEGYTFKQLKESNRIYSPRFNTKQEMYKEIQRLENCILQEYRYNPLWDFEDTWIAYLCYKFLGVGSAEDVKEYNRQYFKANKPEIADYYML